MGEGTSDYDAAPHLYYQRLSEKRQRLSGDYATTMAGDYLATMTDIDSLERLGWTYCTENYTKFLFMGHYSYIVHNSL